METVKNKQTKLVFVVIWRESIISEYRTSFLKAFIVLVTVSVHVYGVGSCLDGGIRGSICSEYRILVKDI